MGRTKHNMEDEISQRIALNIRIERKKKNITIQNIADQMGLTYQQVQKYEVCRNRISANSLYRIAEILKVDVAVFYKEPDSETLEKLQKPIKYDAASKKLMQVYSKISDKRLKKELYDLVAKLSKED